MTDMVYFDSEKRAFGQHYGDIEITASIDNDTWFLYSEDSAGTTWDIIDGNFVELKPAEQIRHERKKYGTIP